MKFRLDFRFGMALLTLLTLASPPPAAAQTDVTTGRITGQVTDQESQPLPGVTIEAKNKGTGYTMVQVTDSRGLYRIVNVPVGAYTVTASLAGFQPQTRSSLTITVGASVTADFKLALSSITETLIVTAEVPTIETTQTASQVTVDNNAIQSLPINGRNFTDFVLLTPNAQKDTQRGNLALGGQRGINTNVTVDGVDFNNAFFGGTAGSAEGRAPFSISQESVREFQVIQNGASVEFGRSGGGFVNVVTKSGTNTFHGSAFYYNRPNSLVAKFADGKDPRDQKTSQFGASIGGPILRDKLFFFGSFDQQDQNTTQPIDGFDASNPNSLSAIDPAFATKYPAYASSTPDYVFTKDGRVFFARLDFQATDKHRFLVRGNFSKYEGDNATNTGSQHSVGFNGVEKNDTKTYVGQWNGTLSSSLINDLNLQYTKDDTPREDKAPTLPEVQLGASVRLGGISFLPITGTADRFSVGDTMTYLTGTHAAKLGFEYNRTGMDQIFKGNWRGVFIFNGTTNAAIKANFLAGRWGEYRQFFGLNGLSADDAGRFDKNQKELSFFAQDQWFVLPNLTVTLGIRYERLDNPDDPVLNLNDVNSANGTYRLNGEIPDVNNQWSPRLSVSWSPEKNGQSVVRFSAGRYWSRTPMLLFAQLYTSNGIAGTQYVISAGNSSGNNPTQPTDPLSPGWGANFRPVGVAQITGSPTNLAAPGVSAIDPGFTNPRTDKVSLAIERDVFGFALGLEGIWAKTSNLERLGDQNLQVSTNRAADCPGLSNLVTCYARTRPNRAYGRVTTYLSDARSRFGSISFSARKNFKGGFRAFGSVTWAQDKDSDSNERNFSGIFAEDVNNIELNYGFSSRDIRWRMLANLSYERNITSTIGVFASGLFNYQTGRPYTAFTRVDGNRDTVNSTDRPTIGDDHIANNTYRQPDFYTLDVRLGVGVELGPGKLSVFGEIFNLTNTGNRSTTNTAWGAGQVANSTFGVLNQVTDTPRTVQIAARYDF